MGSIYVRDVSDDTLLTLELRATRAGQSLQAFVWQLLEREAVALTTEETAHHAGVTAARSSVTADDVVLVISERVSGPRDRSGTSALVEFLVGADPLAEAVRSTTIGEVIAAPYAVDLEMALALRGLVRSGKLSADEAERALELLAAMGLRRYEHFPLLPRIWELRDNMWPYDAAYVALAESLQITLVTIDAKFSRVPGVRCQLRSLRDG